MGKIEKKFQKKKEREREVHKKILAKRAASRAHDKESRKMHLLEKATSKKEPIKRISPELQNTLDMIKKLEASSKLEIPTDVNIPATGFAPDSPPAKMEIISKNI